MTLARQQQPPPSNSADECLVVDVFDLKNTSTTTHST